MYVHGYLYGCVYVYIYIYIWALVAISVLQSSGALHVLALLELLSPRDPRAAPRADSSLWVCLDFAFERGLSYVFVHTSSRIVNFQCNSLAVCSNVFCLEMAHRNMHT